MKGRRKSKGIESQDKPTLIDARMSREVNHEQINVLRQPTEEQTSQVYCSLATDTGSCKTVSFEQ